MDQTSFGNLAGVPTITAGQTATSAAGFVVGGIVDHPDDAGLLARATVRTLHRNSRSGDGGNRRSGGISRASWDVSTRLQTVG
jgi:hypothetical protein